ncbi:hypothetical protein [uncultured Modestobacter sp.]|uniref:hypothetical protein n=1 Tax=uncultured Modestobacter sp. TaxID=380048 RepID=UPI0026031180|nr:hypothetical protein [uncultured Modestobacter sp.]
MTETAVLPAELDQLDAVLPVGPLARLVSPGVPRWAFTTVAADLTGPWRREPRVGAEVLERGLPALPERPRLLVKDYRIVGGLREAVYRETGEMLPAQAAVPPLRRLVELAGDQGTLVALVEHLDGLAGIDVAPTEPDAPEGWTVDGWPAMRTIMGEVPPPLRWSPPVGGARRPELAALRPGATPERLVGVPRVAPPARRPDGGLVGMDARLLAVRALVQHAASVGAVVDREDVVRLVGWVCGPERGVTPVTGRGSLAREWASAGVREAERELAAADPGEVADQLLTERAGRASAE